MTYDTPITTDDRGLKKILGQKQPALVLMHDGTQTDKPLQDALKREAKKRAGDVLIIRVDVADNPQTYALYDHPELPALVTLTPAFFGRKIKSNAEGVRPSDVRNHLAHLLEDQPLPEDKPVRQSNGGSSGKKPTVVTDSTFRREVLRSKQPVLVDFWAVWCGPCQAVAPFVETMAGKYCGKVKVAKLNVDENRAISGQFGIQSIPTFILFEGGQPVARLSGANPAAIEQMIQDVLIPE